MTRMYALVVLISVASLHGAIAQQPETKTQRLTIAAAVQLALKNNPELQASKLEMEKSRERVHEAWGTTMPSIGLSAQYSNALKKPVFFLPGSFIGQPQLDVVAVEIGSTHAVSMALTASQILFNGAVFIGVGAASIYSQAAEELYRGKEVETVTKVRKAFYGVLLATEALKMMQSTLKNAEENLKNVQLMKEQGIVSDYDELRAQVGVENLRPMVMQAENNRTLALDGLKGSIGAQTSDEIEIEGELSFVEYDSGLLAEASQRAMESNSNLRALRYQVEVNSKFLSVERSNYLPTLAAFGNYQYQGQQNTLNFSSMNFVSSSTVGLNLSMNLFQGFQTNARVDQAKLEIRKSEAMLASAETGIKTAVHSLVGTINQTRRRVEAQQKTVEQAERGYRIVTTRFSSGAATQLEVNDAQNALNQANVNRIQAIYEYLAASADLDQLLGRLPQYAIRTEQQ
jgi:outer membrane protein